MQEARSPQAVGSAGSAGQGRSAGALESHACLPWAREVNCRQQGVWVGLSYIFKKVLFMAVGRRGQGLSLPPAGAGAQAANLRAASQEVSKAETCLRRSARWHGHTEVTGGSRNTDKYQKCKEKIETSILGVLKWSL